MWAGENNSSVALLGIRAPVGVIAPDGIASSAFSRKGVNSFLHSIFDQQRAARKMSNSHRVELSTGIKVRPFGNYPV
jgi:hypothetical protein